MAHSPAHRPRPQAPGRPVGRTRRLMTRFVAIALVCCFMPIFVFGATVAATGTVTVRVHEAGPEGINLYIPVPAVLLDAALVAAPMLIPEEELADVRRETAPFLPGLMRLADDLADVPAGSVLVHVENADEEVTISKTWRNFEINVDSEDTQVQVTVPARLLKRSLHFLG